MVRLSLAVLRSLSVGLKYRYSNGCRVGYCEESATEIKRGRSVGKRIRE